MKAVRIILLIFVLVLLVAAVYWYLRPREAGGPGSETGAIRARTEAPSPPATAPAEEP